MNAMKRYSHPAMRDVTLLEVMAALSDPCRMAIVLALLREGRCLACNEVPLDVSKATRSHHFDVLRDAGLIGTCTEGTKCMTSLRREDLEDRFPGLVELLAREAGLTLSAPVVKKKSAPKAGKPAAKAEKPVKKTVRKA